MPVFCHACARKLDVQLPPLRVSREPCKSCGGYDEGQPRNYSIDTIQIPGSNDDPNRKAEVESNR